MINSLFLKGRLHNIPEWILSLNGLFKLELKQSQLAKSPLEVLWDFPSLKVLHLHDAYSGEVLEFRAGWFLELRILVIEQCRWLECVVILGLAMPKLQMLTIENCNCLTMVCIATITLDHLKKTNVPEHLLEFSDLQNNKKYCWAVRNNPLVRSYSNGITCSPILFLYLPGIKSSTWLLKNHCGMVLIDIDVTVILFLLVILNDCIVFHNQGIYMSAFI